MLAAVRSRSDLPRLGDVTQSVGDAPGMTAIINELIDIERFLLTEPASPRYRRLVAAVHGQLADTGCSVLAGFLRPAARDRLRAESDRLAPAAYTEIDTVNVYNTDHTTLPDGHPGRRTFERGNAFVARDAIPADSVLEQLYSAPVLQRFVADCFGLDQVHELADPFAGLVLNVVAPGRSHPWHFDVNEFTVSMLTGAPEGGGVFEFCPNVRTPDDENLDAVNAVLDGTASQLVRRLALQPGDLQLFKGRYALHRVSPVTGTRARHSAVLAYSERPGVISSVARTRQLFGRVAPDHLSHERETVRVDQLLD